MTLGNRECDGANSYHIYDMLATAVARVDSRCQPQHRRRSIKAVHRPQLEDARVSHGGTDDGNASLDFYYAPTPNGWKVAILLEEAAIAHRLITVRLADRQQDDPAFRQISPNGRIPAIVDHSPVDGVGPLSVFESGAILLYLAEKQGCFLPTDPRSRSSVVQWLMWQMSGLGPMAGQNGHFLLYAPGEAPYATERFGREVDRLYGVLDTQLAATGRYVCGDYSIADMACFPWVMTHKRQQVAIENFPNVRRWFAAVRSRDAVQRGLAMGDGIASVNSAAAVEARRRLIAQSRRQDDRA